MFTILSCMFLAAVVQSNATPMWQYQRYLELPAVALFREYLRIDTSVEENLKIGIEFWIRQAKELGLPYKVYEPNGLPIFVATLEGYDPSLPSIMLNSHMDVVKAVPDDWTHPPYSAYMDENGNIFGRGAQDTKDVAIQYLEAIRRIKKENIILARTIHMTVMPDEEVGGDRGIKEFVKTEDFRALNIGFALDEGMSSRNSSLFVTNVDKRPWQMEFVVYGEGGHGLSMPDDSAMEKAQRLINSVMAFRERQKKIMKSTNPLDTGAYTSINVNMLQSGLAPNIIPAEVKVVIDMRLSRHADPKEMQEMVGNWLINAGNNTKLTFIRRVDTSVATPVDVTNPYWMALKNTLNSMDIKVSPIVCPATSDALVLRSLGIPALGFATKANTVPRLHNSDEYHHVETFLKGIDIYYEVIKELGNLPHITAHSGSPSAHHNNLF